MRIRLAGLLVEIEERNGHLSVAASVDGFGDERVSKEGFEQFGGPLLGGIQRRCRRPVERVARRSDGW